MTHEVAIFLKTPHPKQQEFLDNRKRFNVLKCGRRFGKTQVVQELISECIEHGQIIGVWTPTYKDLYEIWGETKRTFKDIVITSSETVKQITFEGGGKIDFWSMEDPDSGRGRKYHRVIIDECEKAGKFQQAWEETIRATLTDYAGDGYFLSTPKFGETYFKKLCLFEKEREDWKTFIYTTYDNPHIPHDEIDQARQLLHPSIFECEYLANDVDGKALNPFAFQFDELKHIGTVTLQPKHQVIISVDFNLNPFSVLFSHIWQDVTGWHFHIFDEAEIENGSIQKLVEVIRARYAGNLHYCKITGDAMGRRGELGQRDNASLYTQLQRELGLQNNQIITYANPTHENSRADCNYTLFNFPDLKISPNCKGLIRDMRMVQCDAMGSIVKRNRNDLSQRADLLDAFRYLVNSFLMGWIKDHQKQIRFIK